MTSEQPDAVFSYRLEPDQTVVEGVVESTAAMYDVDPTDLEPLYSSVDPDALDALCQPSAAGHPTVRFRYNGCDVQVSSDRVIELWPVD